MGTRELTSSFLKQSGIYPDLDPEIYSRKNLDPEISSRGAQRVHTGQVSRRPQISKIYTGTGEYQVEYQFEIFPGN